nr:uncharacterized protein LOC111511913 [Leptinotarsa decemlineata]
MNANPRNEIVSCIDIAMKEHGFSNIVVNLLGTNEKGEGFAADLIFAEVTGTDQDNEERKVHLAIKMGKNSANLRNSLPMRDIYERELFVYRTVLPTFHEFQLERNITETFEAYPKCYKTFLSEDSEVLVFENLKKRGFVLHHPRKPMNLQHIHLVLRNYAKLHALSLAMRDQDKKDFHELTADYTSPMKEFVISSGVFRKKERVCELLENGGRDDLVVKFEKEIGSRKEKIILDILNDVVEESVIIHGDCHNNNFLFRYEENDEENPLDVAILDWQISTLNSPAMDLSCFLYLCASGESLSRLEELLELYHSNLRDFLRQLGSDVEELFPYNILVNHWKKYTPYALALVTTFLELLFFQKQDVPEFENIQEQSDMAKFMEGNQLEDEDLYRERLISVIDHHFNFVLD